MSLHTIGSDCLLNIAYYLDTLSCARLSGTCKFVRLTLNQGSEFLLNNHLKNYQNDKEFAVIKELVSLSRRRRPDAPFFEAMNVAERAKMCLSWFRDGNMNGSIQLVHWQIEAICLILKTHGTPLFIDAGERSGKTVLLKVCSLLLWYSIPNIAIGYLHITRRQHDKIKLDVETFINRSHARGTGVLNLVIIKDNGTSDSFYRTIIKQDIIKSPCKLEPIADHTIMCQFDMILIEDICYVDPRLLFNIICTDKNKDKVRAISSYRINTKIIDYTWWYLSGFDAVNRAPIFMPGLGQYSGKGADRFPFHDNNPCQYSINNRILFRYTTKPFDKGTLFMIATGMDYPHQLAKKAKQ